MKVHYSGMNKHLGKSVSLPNIITPLIFRILIIVKRCIERESYQLSNGVFGIIIRCIVFEKTSKK